MLHGANMGPTWILSAPDGPHVGPMNLAIREHIQQQDPVVMYICESPVRPWSRYSGDPHGLPVCISHGAGIPIPQHDTGLGNWGNWKIYHGLVQDCSISSTLAMEILQSCIKLSIWNNQCIQAYFSQNWYALVVMAELIFFIKLLIMVGITFRKMKLKCMVL